jgi:hypothetical protein
MKLWILQHDRVCAPHKLLAVAVTIDGSTGLLIVNGQKLFPLRLRRLPRELEDVVHRARVSTRADRDQVDELVSAGASFIRAGAAIGTSSRSRRNSNLAKARSSSGFCG